MTEAALLDIERDLNGHRMQYNIARSSLRSALSQARAPEGAEERLLSAAEEFGTRNTLELVAKSPARFELKVSLPAQQLQALEPDLNAALDATYAMNRLLQARESLLPEDRKHAGLVVALQGREVELDVKARTMTYLDTNERVTLNVEPVATRESEPTNSANDGDERDR